MQISSGGKAFSRMSARALSRLGVPFYGCRRSPRAVLFWNKMYHVLKRQNLCRFFLAILLVAILHLERFFSADRSAAAARASLECGAEEAGHRERARTEQGGIGDGGWIGEVYTTPPQGPLCLSQDAGGVVISPMFSGEGEGRGRDGRGVLSIVNVHCL